MYPLSLTGMDYDFEKMVHMNVNHLKQVGIRIVTSVANYTGMLTDIH